MSDPAVQRYCQWCRATHKHGMMEHEQGEYVTYEDYAALCTRLEGVEQENSDARFAMFLSWRGIESPCKGCGGAGERAYSSTATWHGGIGGQMITTAVCSDCWGSGDAQRKWADQRQLQAQLAAAQGRVKELEEQRTDQELTKDFADLTTYCRENNVHVDFLDEAESEVDTLTSRCTRLEEALKRIVKTAGATYGTRFKVLAVEIAQQALTPAAEKEAGVGRGGEAV